MIVRSDRVLARLMEAFDQGDLRTVESCAERMSGAHPELRCWSAYIVAGCRALAGQPAAGLRLLAGADARGGWWSPALLADPALAAIWPLDANGLRARSEARWRAAQARAEVSWEVVGPASRAAAAVISLHGNCPVPAHLFGPLWARLRSCVTYLARSPQLLAPAVHEWRDRERAMRDVAAVGRAARAANGPDVPLVVAGLGAGGRIAVEAVLTGAVDAKGALAFAPHMRPLERVEPARAGAPRIVILTGGTAASVASCEAFARWAQGQGCDIEVRHPEGMGHAYPARFAATVERTLGAVLGERSALSVL